VTKTSRGEAYEIQI